METDGRGAPLFTSGLSVSEFALLDPLGPRPLAQVMGANVVRTGWQYLPALEPGMSGTAAAYRFTGRMAGAGPSVTGTALMNPYTEASPSQVRAYQWRTEVVCELDVRTEAWNLARRGALERLREEAVRAGADAVVGVRVRRGEHDRRRGTIEFVVYGTAIRLPGSAAAAAPVLSDLSVQDYWRLHATGHEPVAFAATTAVVFGSPSRSTRAQRLRAPQRSWELDELGRGFQLAREVVRARLLGQVIEAGASGVVGVEYSHSVHREKLALASSLGSATHRGWRLGPLGVPYRVSGASDAQRSGWVITVHVAGTAIQAGGGPAAATQPPRAVVTLGESPVHRGR